ncbi:MAG: maleylacetoacetate isomerase [Sphingobium sp.]|uniref:maleylacetoacetate isomerase n=1 Tax=Sphingobium sp. TaxID=1912891 RepID=UPI0029A090FB|nr:maleylacetoacetate isomerase [Sphingobium sp.]MDX3909582.1 maleylacetoacetate isomerase [Sphingobium sp.]
MTDSIHPVVLHDYFRSSAAFRVRIALNIKGIEYQSIPHHLRKGEQSAASYLAVNPQGLVPALEIDGSCFTQSLAIIEYLDEAYPHPPLLPADLVGRARVRSIAQIVACDIHPLNNLRVLRYLRAPLGHPEDTVRSWYAHWISQGFSALESILNRGPEGSFCHGDNPGLADICLVPQLFNARNFDVDLTSFPRIEEIVERAMALPAFMKAHPSNQPDAE